MYRPKKEGIGHLPGAQLIADVLGADVVPMPEKEIGWFPLDWIQDARSHPLLDFLPGQQMVLHWHGDMFYRPEDAINLATSKGCENQGFLLDDYVLGLQFHLEMTKEGLSGLIAHSENELAQAGGRFIQDAETMLKDGHFEESQRIMEKILDQFVWK